MPFSAQNARQLLTGLILFLAGWLPLAAQSPTYEIDAGGRLSYLHFPAAGADTVAFRNGDFAGPVLLLDDAELPLERRGGADEYAGSRDGLEYSLRYAVKGESLCLTVTCSNKGRRGLENVRLSLRLGIDNCMPSYPEWRSIYFPTLLKCEKTHFWGYFMNPDGNILTIASPDPVASYRLNYNNSKHNFASGHLIYTTTLDLLQPGRLPEENPEGCDRLGKGETRSWSIWLSQAGSLSEVGGIVARQTQAPFIQSPLYTVRRGEDFRFEITAGSRPAARLLTPDGKIRPLRVSGAGRGRYVATYTPQEGEGLYRLYVTGGRHTSQGWFSVRYPWSDYMKAARQASLRYRQKASSHTESWYGLMSAYLAKAYFPEGKTDAEVEEMFQEIYPLMYDRETFLPTSGYNRIQNHAMMASLFVLRYKAGHDMQDMYAAAALADYLLSKQTSDGAYRSGKVHYTSVIYIAKSIMEVMEAEKALAATSDHWAATYRRHYASVRKAMDDLVRNLDNLQTEGENTYEDGMIACSYTQLAMFALLQPEGSAERTRYLRAAEHFVRGHRCLSQLLIPDSRVNGGSLRFWESQYDVLTYPNFINSPHGWSAWRIYGLKYLYRLTADEAYLKDMMNAIGSCVQLLNPRDGVLNWAFVSDPYVEVKYFVEDDANKGRGKHVDRVIGREYLPMISDWYRAPENKWVSGYWMYDGGCCDNDVHEIFKCMEEVALSSAYFHLRPDGSFLAWNCRAERQGGAWKITPDEAAAKYLYVNTDAEIQTGLQVVRCGR